MLNLTWNDIHEAARKLEARARAAATGDYSGVYGIPQGGAPVAVMLAGMMSLPILDVPDANCLIVDDLVDSGSTLRRYNTCQHRDALYRKPHSPVDLAPDAITVDDWIGFPWERDNGEPTDAVVRLLQHIGEDVNREGLLDTPKRYVKALQEMTSGYQLDVPSILSTTFDEASDQMVVLKDIEFASLCEHHLAPFRGTATIGYIPRDRVVGLSKLARLVDAYSRRLQVQERMTQQIADALWEHLNPEGVGVVVTAHHSCMGNRGVRKHQGMMSTSVMLGAMRDSDAARQEFLHLSKV